MNKLLLIVVLLLMPSLIAGEVPPQVAKPPVVAHWFDTKPPVPKDIVQNMVDHPAVVLRVIHEHDREFCENGPIDTWRYPEVKRCDGAI